MNKLKKYIYAQNGYKSDKPITYPKLSKLEIDKINQANQKRLFEENQAQLSAKTTPTTQAVKNIGEKIDRDKRINSKQDKANLLGLALSSIPVIGEVYSAGNAIANTAVDLTQGEYGDALLSGGLYGLNKIPFNKLGNKYLPNAYEYNPFAKGSKINPFSKKSFLRQIDEETYLSDLKKGKITGKDVTKPSQGISLQKNFGEDAYFNKGSLYYPDQKTKPYLYEAFQSEDTFIPKLNNRTKNLTRENTTARVPKEPLKLSDVTTYKHDWLKGYIPVKQTGGTSNNLTIIEDGEYVKDNQGKVGKITNIPTHDDNELIIDNQVKTVPKGKGGQGIYNVKSVLSNSYNGEGSTNRNKSDNTYTYRDEEVTLKPQQALQLAEQLNLKIKRPLGSISPSKLMDKLLESRENLVRKYKDIDKPLKSERQTNSFTANVDVLSSIPTPENIYDFIFSNQENSKSENQELYAKTGIHIDPSKRGTFSAQATRMGMSVQEAARTILNAPEGRYSPEMRKKANFARNFAKQTGGLTDLEIEDLEYQTGGLRKPQQDLVKWTNQKWRTNSGKKSSETGERYLPDKAWDNLSSEEKARTNRAKREGGGTGNNVPQPKDIANKTSKYRTAQTGIDNDYFKSGGSTVNSAGNYTKPEMRKRLFNRIKNEASMGTAAGKWSARKAQKLARLYKENGGGYRQQGGRLQQFPTMYGSKPVALVNTPQGVKRVDMIDNRTVSMDDMFNKDSVQVQGNKAVIIKKNPLKKYVR